MAEHTMYITCLAKHHHFSHSQDSFTTASIRLSPSSGCFTIYSHPPNCTVYSYLCHTAQWLPLVELILPGGFIRITIWAAGSQERDTVQSLLLYFYIIWNGVCWQKDEWDWENNILREYLINVIPLWTIPKTVTANSRFKRPNLKVCLSTGCAESVLNFEAGVQAWGSGFGNVLVAALNILVRENDSTWKNQTGWF